MRVIRWTSTLLLGACAFAQTGRAPAPTPEARARQAVEWALHGEYVKLLANSDEAMKQAAPLDTWQKQFAPRLAGLGKLKSLGAPVSSLVAPYRHFVFPAQFEKAAIDITVSIARDGRIASFFLKPSANQSAATIKSAAGKAREAVDWVLAGEYQKIYDASTPQMQSRSLPTCGRRKWALSPPASGN